MNIVNGIAGVLFNYLAGGVMLLGVIYIVTLPFPINLIIVAGIIWGINKWLWLVDHHPFFDTSAQVDPPKMEHIPLRQNIQPWDKNP